MKNMSLRETFLRNLIALVVTISAALSGYFAAYTGLRVELSGKAEERYVSEMDIRLSKLETVINERFATREDLYDLKKEMITKLNAIETALAKIE
jgi:hypothetical protein